MNTYELAWDVVKIMSGALGTGIVLFFTIIKAQARTEGKLELLIGMMQLAEKNREDIGEIKAVLHKKVQDLNHCFQRVRDLEDPPLSQQ